VVSGGVGRSAGAELVEAFIEALAAKGRSSYTQRSYGLGVRHFLAWSACGSLELEAVDRRALASYVAEYRHGDGDGLPRAPSTVNQRVSALAAFFEFLIESGVEGWRGRSSPVPAAESALAGGHGMPGRDAPSRGRRAELRQRVPRRLPRRVEPEVARRLIDSALSWRDRALLTLLWRTGQRIGDWSERHGQHGVLGMRLADLDRRSGTVVVRLKGARDEHRVPVSDDFWPLFARYAREERGLGEPHEPAWVALRRGRGRPLCYATFESQLRALGRRVGVRVTAHMFRHALAQALVDTAGLKVAQEVLGHAHISTTAATYARVDEPAMVRALERVGDLFELAARAPERATDTPIQDGYVFAYDPATAAALDAAAGQSLEPGP
jgi:integrase/recombinase XerD